MELQQDRSAGTRVGDGPTWHLARPPSDPLTTDVPVGAWTLGVLFDIVYLVNRRHDFAISADIIIAARLALRWATLSAVSPIDC